MVHGKNRISYRIDRRLSGLAGPDYDATISFGLPYEPEDSQYGKYRFNYHGSIPQTTGRFPSTDIRSGPCRRISPCHASRDDPSLVASP